jgi:surface protein
MGDMFNQSEFNLPIGNWNVKSVSNMSHMFSNSKFNKPIESWDVRNVSELNYMFRSSKFNQNISNWCPNKIEKEPDQFSSYCPITDENKPKWGTCSY